MTRSITVHSTDRTWCLAPGEALTFGRRTSDRQPPSRRHLGLSDHPSLHSHAGTITADDHGWIVVNAGRWLSLRVFEVGGSGRADVAPGRSLRSPWSRGRVEVIAGEVAVAFEVDAPAGPEDVAVPARPLVTGDTASLQLDRTAGYFRAVVALCEPRLRDPGTERVATTAEIALALNRAGERPPVSVKAVERRLAHARRRFGVGGDDPEGISAAGLEVRDAARQFADLLLRVGAVTVAELAILEPRDRP